MPITLFSREAKLLVVITTWHWRYDRGVPRSMCSCFKPLSFLHHIFEVIQLPRLACNTHRLSKIRVVAWQSEFSTRRVLIVSTGLSFSMGGAWGPGVALVYGAVKIWGRNNTVNMSPFSYLSHVVCLTSVVQRVASASPPCFRVVSLESCHWIFVSFSCEGEWSKECLILPSSWHYLLLS